MGFKDTVLPDPLLKHHFVKRLTFRENTRKLHKDNSCLIRALALRLHANEKLEEENPKLFNLFIEKTGGTDPATLRGVCMEHFAVV